MVWGLLDTALDVVEARERETGAEFDRVAFLRPDLRLTKPIGNWREYDAATWHSVANPPDALWILPRDAAAVAFRSLRTLAACDEACCADAAAAPLMVSWFVPCYTARRLWSEGLRIQLNNRVVGSLRLHNRRAKRETGHLQDLGTRDARVGNTWRSDGTRCSPWVGDNHADAIWRFKIYHPTQVP